MQYFCTLRQTLISCVHDQDKRALVVVSWSSLPIGAPGKHAERAQNTGFKRVLEDVR
jgi:hypothetical protein